MADDAALLIRVGRVEASNRRWRSVALLGLALAVAGFERFKRSFYSSNVYTPSLVLIDPRGGVAALQLDQEGRGSQLTLGENGNVANLTLRSGLDGSRSIVFVDRKARKRAEFGINQDGRPNLRLFDEKGNRTWEAQRADP